MNFRNGPDMVGKWYGHALTGKRTPIMQPISIYVTDWALWTNIPYTSGA